jgi:serine/threonine protein kinase
MDSTIAAPLGPDDPREIGRFSIIGLLGAGGMGEVYLGTAGESYVAVKRVRPQLVSVERFRREVAILHRVPPDVAPDMLASDSTAPRPWFATEYVPGVTVDDAVRLHGRLDRNALWHLLAEVAAQLRVVHEAGIVHRDLKPANVMLLRDGVKLIDFGIARAADQAKLTRSGIGYGTSGFTAPEQDAGAIDVAAPTDVYSLGALLLYAASGRAPGAVPDLEPERAVAPALADIIESCLAKDAASRPTAANLVARAREHLPAAQHPGEPWPPEAMELIAAREDFAATPVSKMPTVPPPGMPDPTSATASSPAPEPAPEPAPVPASVLEPGPSGAPETLETPETPAPPPRPRNRRRRLIVVPLALLIVAGGITTLVLVPFGSPAPTTTLSSNSATAKPRPLHSDTTPRPSTTHQSSSASPSASATDPASQHTTTDPTDPPVNNPTGETASTAAAGGATGPSGDKNYISGSEVTVPGCAGWVDFDGDLYGTISAGDASCSANVIRSGDTLPGDGTTTIQASNFKQANSSEAYWYIGSYQFTEQVCIWNQADSSTQACSSQYTDYSGTVSEG